MCGEVLGEYVKYDIQRSVWVQVKVSNEADNLFPYRSCSIFDYCIWFDRPACLRRVWGAKAARQLNRKFGVSFRLLSKKIEFVLFVALHEAFVWVYNK